MISPAFSVEWWAAPGFAINTTVMPILQTTHCMLSHHSDAGEHTSLFRLRSKTTNMAAYKNGAMTCTCHASPTSA